MTRTCITTVTAIRSEEWIKAVISGGAALFSVDGSAKERVNAALNDMLKTAVTGLAFAPPIPVLESNGNTILGAAVGGIYDMSIAKANSSRKIIHPEHPPHHLQRVDIREDG